MIDILREKTAQFISLAKAITRAKLKPAIAPTPLSTLLTTIVKYCNKSELTYWNNIQTFKDIITNLWLQSIKLSLSSSIRRIHEDVYHFIPNCTFTVGSGRPHKYGLTPKK